MLIRRHYLEYDLHDLTVSSPEEYDGRPVVHAEYATDEKGATRVVSTIGDITELADPGSALGAAITSVLTDDHDDVVEVYLRWPEVPADPDERLGRGGEDAGRPGVRRPCAPRLRGGLPAGAAAGRLLHLPLRATATRSPRTPSSAACTRWSAAG